MIVMAVLVTAIHPRIKSGDRLAAGMLDDADARDKPAHDDCCLLMRRTRLAAVAENPEPDSRGSQPAILIFGLRSSASASA
jgi:hypothetical protein